jgi:hypothetical protein
MNQYRALFALGLVALLVFGEAHADTGDQQEKQQEKACRADAMHFCSAQIPDKNKIKACMKQHISELSPDCRAMFEPGDHSSDGSDNAGNGPVQ